MLHTTRAVVLRTFKQGSSAIVLKAYTEAFGARTYMVRSNGKGSVKPRGLRPLDRLELVVTERVDREMHVVRELRVERPYSAASNDPVRGLLLLFTQEVFYRTLREEAPDPGLFELVQQTLEEIDTGDDPANFPLLMMVRLARQLGFHPESPAPGEDRFDLREGCFFSGTADHGLTLGRTDTQALVSLLASTKDGSPFAASPSVRRNLLEHLLTYFRLHWEGFGQLRSPEVLHALLH